MICNWDSTLQLIVQISSGNVNSSVRARANTHGRAPVSIELPRGRHLGSDAYISYAHMPAPFGLECPHLHCTRVHNKGLQMPTSSCAKAQLKIRASKKMPAPTSSSAPPRRCPRSHLIHVWKDTRVHPLGVHTEMPAPRHTRVQEDTRAGLFLHAP